MVEKVAEELGRTDVTIEKVEDIIKILEYDIMSTTAIVFDGEIKINGRVPSINELKELLHF